jgi:predicted alpha-1,2-mannosidase
MRCRFFLLSTILGASISVPLRAGAQTAPVDWVNEYIGTANEGQTFPATGVPYAMTNWTPQTRAGNVKCIAPYYFADTRIQGFRGSRFMSGSCTQDYGSMAIMPESGELKLGPEERASGFDRKSEVATPYRYAVELSDYGIGAEMTGTSRSGLMRFKFKRAGKAWLLVECNSAKGEGRVEVDTQRNEITVVNPVRRLYAGLGKPAGFSGYFVVQFDRKFQVGGTWSGEERHAGSARQEGGDGLPGAYVSFDLRPGEAVEARIGSSFTSVAEARRNLETEIPGWDIESVAAEARNRWNVALGRVRVEAEPAKKRIFYTAMYHSMLLPRTFSDVSGSYPGFAGEGKIEVAKDFTYYCDFSLWDTFRALHPLLTIIDPDRERDMVRSLIAKGEQGGFLPIYPAWNSYTSEMVGDHADAVIGDAYVKGIRGFDIAEAYRLMRQNAMQLPATRELYADGRGRRALDSYLKYGFIPLEDHVPDAFHKDEQVSRTLEYAYDDFVVGKMAQALGHSDDAAMFERRAQNYRNVIDPATGFARGRHEDGTWVSPFDPAVKASYITEGLPFQYTFFVPQDLPGLVERVGGREKFIAKLDALFAGGYYDHGNEPSHHIAYLYDNAGVAWKTQEHVREVMEKQYSDGPAGLAGNDDCGQMSAWYVLSALGFYPVTPGTPNYEIGTPLFDEATVQVGAGKALRIRAAGAGAGKRYIRSVSLNGVELNRYWITQAEIVGGGDLVFEMSATPSAEWPSNGSPPPR